MGLRKLKPITPGQRFKVVTDFDVVTTDKPEKSLLAPIKKSGGRNNDGKSHYDIEDCRSRVSYADMMCT